MGVARGSSSTALIVIRSGSSGGKIRLEITVFVLFFCLWGQMLSLAINIKELNTLWGGIE